MNRKSKLRSVTSFLAICASVVSACICVLLISGEYHSAHFHLDTYDRELQGWQACRQTNPEYFKANEQAVNSCLTSIDQAQDNFWVKLPKAHLMGLFVLAGLASAASGYLATWAVVWLVGISICKFIRLLAFSLKHSSNKPVHNKYNLHSFATKP
jgi:hypothetical protein